MENNPLNVLAFFAHPDDETMLCGGTLALLSRLGAQVHLVIATRGEGGEMGDPPQCTREELGKVREAELRCAAVALGAASLILMDYQDPLIGPNDTLFPFADDIEEVSAHLVEAIRKTGAQIVLTHGVNGEYGHPAHKLAHQAARRAVASLDAHLAPALYGVMGTFTDCPSPFLFNQDAPADWILDVTPTLAAKVQAALCHATQNALFIRVASHEAGRLLTVPEVVLPVESLSLVLPSSAQEEVFTALLLRSGTARLAR